MVQSRTDRWHDFGQLPSEDGRKTGQPNKLIYHTDYSLPVGQICSALQSLEDSFLEWQEESGNIILERLAFSRVETGSLIIELICVSASVVGADNAADLLTNFFKYIQFVIQALKDTNVRSISPKENGAVESVAKLVAPVASGGAVQLTIIAGSGSTINIGAPDSAAILQQIEAYRLSNLERERRAIDSKNKDYDRMGIPFEGRQVAESFTNMYFTIRRNRGRWQVSKKGWAQYEIIFHPEAVASGSVLIDGKRYCGSGITDHEQEVITFHRLDLSVEKTR